MRRWPLRPLSAVVLVVLAAVASSLITRSAFAGQERLILREQTAQAAAVFVSAFAGVQSSLQLLGEIARSDQDNPALFANATRAVSTTGTLGVAGDGHVWAEGAIGEGATFYFTLNAKENA